MSYESPIKLITDLEYKVIEDQERNIYKAVCSYCIDLDKDELFKLLYDDRKQYDTGYADGRADAVKHGRWIVISEYPKKAECSHCNYPIEHELVCWWDYCPNCGADMREVEE